MKNNAIILLLTLFFSNSLFSQTNSFDLNKDCIWKDSLETIQFLDDSRFKHSRLNFNLNEQYYGEGTYQFIDTNLIKLEFDSVKSLSCEIKLYHSYLVPDKYARFYITGCPLTPFDCQDYLSIRVGEFNYYYNENNQILIPIDSLENKGTFSLMIKNDFIRFDYCFEDEITNFIHVNFMGVNQNILYFRNMSNVIHFVKIYDYDTIELIVGAGIIKTTLTRSNDDFPNLLLYKK